MTKKQIIALSLTLVTIAVVLLIISWKYAQNDRLDETDTSAETQETASLATMEVYPEKTETAPSERAGIATREETETETETATKNWRDGFYSIDAAELENQTAPEFDYSYRPSVGALPAEVTGITEQLLKAVDGKEGALIMAVQIEIQRVRPGTGECQVQIFQEHANGTLIEMIVNGEVVGMLLYNREKGVFEGTTGQYSIP